ncbi:MAG: prepilin-type N-terminal cleavage/methylation domain-containing protein [Candidatus Omnitrophota bacterium]
MKRKQGFTFIELLIILVILGGMVGIATVVFKGWQKSKSTLAFMNMGDIRKAEELLKIESGDYAAARGTQEVNRFLDLTIQSKDYDYSVTNVTADSFVVIAENINKDTETAGAKFLVMGSSGAVSTGATIPAKTGTGPDVIIGGGVTGGGLGQTGGTGTGTGDTTDGGDETGKEETPTGWFPKIYNSDLTNALNILGGSTQGLDEYTLIKNYNIAIEYSDTLPDGAGALWVPTYWLDFYPDDTVVPNTIYVASVLRTLYSEQAIASIIAHEATHADYNYNTEKWVTATMERYGIERSELFWIEDPVTNEMILNDTLDQEYNCFVSMAQVWGELRADQNNASLDLIWYEYERGEEYLYLDVFLRYPDLYYY